MHIALLRAENLRLYPRIEIRPHPRLNILIGPNAAGKTTVLEGLHVLGRAKSFRATDPGELTRFTAGHWNVFADVEVAEIKRRIGVGWGNQGLKLRVNEERATAATLARTLPLQLIDPSGHRLIDEGPGYRRTYIDWGVFHVEHEFYPAWQRFHRALRQRNQALRQNLADGAVNAWNAELAAAARTVTMAREAHVRELAGRLPEQVKRLLDLEQTEVELQPGWNRIQDYHGLLEEQLSQHRSQRTTVQGPHRAELKLKIAGKPIKGQVSRGQQKLLVAALVLAQCAILIDAGMEAPILLVDDFGAELSASYQERLAAALVAYPGQVFISAFEYPRAFLKAEATVFHVEHSQVIPATISSDG